MGFVEERVGARSVHESCFSFDKALILPVVGQSGGWSIAGGLHEVCAMVSP